MASAAHRSRSSRSPNQIDAGQRHQGGIDVEDQQRQRDPDAQEGDEHGQVEGGVGWRCQRDEKPIPQRQLAPRAPQPAARRGPHCDEAEDHDRPDPGAPGDQGQARDAGARRRYWAIGPRTPKDEAAITISSAPSRFGEIREVIGRLG